MYAMIVRARRALGLATLGSALIFGFSAEAGAQTRTVVVAPVAGNPTASGTALRNALTGIVSPSSTNPWLLKVEPGIYDFGSTPLQMRSWIDIEGSGIGVTILRGSVDASSSGLLQGTILGASSAELRLLTVEALGNSNIPASIAMVNLNASPRIYRVRFAVSGSASQWGMRNLTAAPILEEIEVAVAGGTTSYGIVYGSSNVSGMLPEIRRSRISVTDATSNGYGLYLTTDGRLREIRDTEIEVLRGGTAHGIYADAFADTSGQLMVLSDTEIDAVNASQGNYGIYFASALYLQIFRSDVQVGGSGQLYGLRLTQSAAAEVYNSRIVGATGTVSNAGPVSVSNSTLNGGPVSGSWTGCFGVVDEVGGFYTASCPP